MVETILGLLGVATYIVAVVSLAAGVTWLVVKIWPARDADDRNAEAQS